MQLRKLAAAVVVSLVGCCLAASCGMQSPTAKPKAEGVGGNAPAVEIRDDGEHGGDPEVGGEPSEPNYSWSPPSSVPSGEDSVDDPPPDPDTGSTGSVPVGGYSPGGHTPSPGVMPLEPCEKKCHKDYEEMAANCGSLGSLTERKRCADSAYASYKSCREGCRDDAKRTCLDMYEDCASRNYRPCNKVFGKNRKVLCSYCLDDCNARRSYQFKQCTECGFE